ncbi:LamG-like jellyroll fold domain-containing protein [Arthrobacter sp. GCM10027362]|uniref:LamG-like jellyroll fold domain-containing protein n=1 Tax=Arthrobacter sp. GCM10027362 TaxID=3273379 RepID=UPI00363AC492
MRRVLTMATAGLMVSAALSVAAPAPATALSEHLSFSALDEPTWQTNGTVWALAESNGVVFAGGTFSQLTPPAGTAGTAIAVTSLASFDAATGQPLSCRPVLTSSTGTTTVRALDVSPDGKTLYIGGHFTAVNGTQIARLAALDIATCKLTSFRPGAISATVRAIDATASTVYLGGDFTTVRGETRERFAAIDAASGQLLPWTANADGVGRAVSVSADGTMVAVGGDFFNVNSQYSHSIAVTKATDGTVLKAYPAGFIPDTSVTKAITSDSTSFYVANEGTGGGVFDGKLAINYSDLNQRWRNTCLGANQALAVFQGTLYSANHAHDCAGMGWQPDGRRIYLQAENADTSATIAWKPDLNDGIGEGIGPRALVTSAKAGKTYLWVGGEFTRTNQKDQRGLTRFADGPRSAAPTRPGSVTAESLQDGRVQVRWKASTDNDDGRLTYRVYRNGGSTPIATLTGDSTWWYQPQVSFIDTTAVPGTRYTYQVTASDGATTTALSATASVTTASQDAPYAATVQKEGANLYWRYSETGDVYGADSSNAGNHHVRYMKTPLLQAAPNAVDGEAGSAIGFDGVEDYALNDAVEPGPSVYTVETWFRTDTTRGGKLVGFGNGRPFTGTQDTRLSNSYDRHIYMTNSGQIVFGAYTGSTVTVKTAKAFNDNQWHHVVATQGPSGMVLYVDGKIAGRNGNTVAQNYTGSWRVGGDNLNGWPDRPLSNFFAGQLDETAVYPGVLTATQVVDHYTKSGRTPDVPQKPADAYGARVFDAEPDLFWRFDSLAGNKVADSGIFGTDGLLNGTVTSAAGVSGQGAGLGADGHISSSTSYSGPQQYAAELWFSTRATTGGRLIGFSNQQAGLSSNYDRHVYMRDDGRLVFGTWTGRENTITTSGAYNDGKWHHVVATQSSDGLRLYVDGALAGSHPQTAAQVYTGYWRVGGDNLWGGASSRYLTGQVDEVAVYNKALGADEVKAHYVLGTGGELPDTESPSAVQGLKAEGGTDSATLSWEAATDDVGVTGYRVHRSASAGFTADAASQVAEVTGTRFVDEGLEQGTWYYKVVAVDAAGNAGPASAEASAVVAEAPVEPTTVLLAPAADAMVNEGSSGTNYGSSNRLASRGSLGYTSYLKFELPEAPAGTVLTGAELAIRTASDSIAGSADAHQVRLAEAAWDEATVTWRNRPALADGNLGEFSAVKDINTAYTAALQPAALKPAADGTITLAITSTGTDNLWFWSREQANSSYRPELRLTFEGQ